MPRISKFISRRPAWASKSGECTPDHCPAVAACSDEREADQRAVRTQNCTPSVRFRADRRTCFSPPVKSVVMSEHLPWLAACHRSISLAGIMFHPPTRRPAFGLGLFIELGETVLTKTHFGRVRRRDQAAQRGGMAENMGCKRHPTSLPNPRQEDQRCFGVAKVCCRARRRDHASPSYQPTRHDWAAGVTPQLAGTPSHQALCRGCWPSDGQGREAWQLCNLTSLATRQTATR